MTTPNTIPTSGNFSNKGTSSASVADDFQKVVNEAETLVKAIGDEGGAQMNQMRDRLTTAMHSARDRLMSWERDAAEFTRRAAASTDQYVHENPWKSVAISAAVGTSVGIVVGMLISRR